MMATTIEIDKKYHEKMPLEKKTELLFRHRSESFAYNLDDQYHTIKRSIGFAWFDRMVEDCRNGNCPDYCSDDIFYALTDLSIEGYVLQKAYLFSGAEIGVSDKERYFKALGRINTILTCKKETELNINLFNQDSRQVYFKAVKTSTFYQSARLRKAYWSYLKNSPDNDQIEDYFSTCGFINKLHRIYNKKRSASEDLEQYKQILSENHHIATPIDLYRFCIVRKKQATPDDL